MDFGHFWETYFSTFFLKFGILRWLLRGGWTGPAQPPGPEIEPEWNRNGTEMEEWNRNGTETEPTPPEIQIHFQFEAPMTLHLRFLNMYLRAYRVCSLALVKWVDVC